MSYINSPIPDSAQDFSGPDQRVSYDYIVLHTTTCSAPTADAGFHSGSRKASAHRIISENGDIWVELPDADVAWGAANWYVNQRAFSLEHEDNGNYMDSVRTPQLYASSAQQLADWCRKYNIPCEKVGVDANHTPVARGIVLHKEVSLTGTACPDGLDWERCIREAQALLTSAPVMQSKTGKVEVTGTGSEGLNIRTAPHATAAIATTVPDGTIMDYVGVAQGDDVNGNSTWYVNSYGHYWAAYFTTAVAQPAPAPAPVAAPVDTRPEYVKNATHVDTQKVYATSPVDLVDLTSGQVVKTFPEGTEFDIDLVTTVGEKTYAITVYSASKNIWNGLDKAHLDAKPLPTPAAPAETAPVAAEPVDPPVTVQTPPTKITPAVQASSTVQAKLPWWLVVLNWVFHIKA